MSNAGVYAHLRPPKATTYEGIQYRSRSEAKWALILTELGVSFGYEPETFALASGEYRPDFWLPDLDCYLEVKPHDVIDPRLSELGAYVAKRIYVANGDLPFIETRASISHAMHMLRGRIWLKWPELRADQALVRESSGRINIAPLAAVATVSAFDPDILAAYSKAIHHRFTAKG